MKVCIKCNIEKPISLFVTDHRLKSGIRNYCRECKNKPHRDKNAILKSKYIEDNKDKIAELLKVRLEKNKIRSQKYLKDNYQSRYEKRKIYIQKNKAHLNMMARLHYYKNKEHRLKLNKIREIERRKANPLIAIKDKLRLRILMALKQAKVPKRSSTVNMLGASIEVSKKYIERQFKKGMTWENNGIGIGKWHIDHKIPLSSAKTGEELIKLFHYTNLQPLWAKDNLAKHKKILPTQMTLTI